jgi:imidazolonepropionase-like amidohydrolase
VRPQLPASALLLLLSSIASAQSGGKLALVGGMLLDGYEVPPLHHAAVVIEGNRIVQVGPAAEIGIPPDAQVVDTRGRVMMPGLIDLHVHLQILGHGDYDRWDPWIAQNDLVGRVSAISARQLLMAGVTSAVDLGGTLEESLEVRDQIERGSIPGPRMNTGRGDGRPQGLPLCGDGGLPGATAGSAARERLRTGDLGRGAALARGIPSTLLLRDDAPGDASSCAGTRSSTSRRVRRSRSS